MKVIENIKHILLVKKSKLGLCSLYKIIFVRYKIINENCIKKAKVRLAKVSTCKNIDIFRGKIMKITNNIINPDIIFSNNF